MGIIDVTNLSSEKGIKLIHLNARSLFSKITDIFVNFGFCDIIVITETWLNNSTPTAAINVDGYSVIRQDRYENSNKKGGGICIYVREHFMYETLDTACAISPDYEMLGIKLKIKDIKPFHIIGTYRPPAGNMTRYMEKLNEVLENINLTRSELFLMGDVNIDYNSDKLLKKLKIKNFETKFGLRQLIEDHTRVTASTSTTIDWVYTSTEYVTKYGIVNYNISDHLPTFVVRKKPRGMIRKIQVKGRSYLRYDMNVFQQILDGLNWEVFDNSNNPTEMWDCLEDNITVALNQICPIKNLTVPEIKPNWLTNDIVQLMRRRDKMYKEARRKRDPVLWRKATFLRNRVEMVIKNHKRDKIRNELEQNKNNPKKFWQNINSLLGKQNNVLIQRLNSENGDTIYEGKDLAEHINNFFAEIGPKLADDIINLYDVNPEKVLFQGPFNINSDNITNREITTNELESLLKKVKVDKSSAIPDIKTQVLVHAFSHQIERVVRMYNGSLTQCTFPHKWKKAIIVPLPKIANPKTVTDMRPISLLPFPGKIMEMIVS